MGMFSVWGWLDVRVGEDAATSQVEIPALCERRCRRRHKTRVLRVPVTHDRFVFLDPTRSTQEEGGRLEEVKLEEMAESSTRAGSSGREWEYMPAINDAKMKKKKTKLRKTKLPILPFSTLLTHVPSISSTTPVTMSDSDSDYEHWRDLSTVASSATAVLGYDTHNGLRQYEYQPANEGKAPSRKVDSKKKDEPKKTEASKKDNKLAVPTLADAPAPPTYQHTYPPQYVPFYPNFQYSCYPAPMYYGLPPPQIFGYGYSMPPGYGYPFASAPPPPARDDGAKPKDDAKPKENSKPNDGAKPKEDDDKADKKKEKKSKRPETMKWQGRTKAEVDEDNMKIAAREGAFAKRRVAPVGLEADQQVWVVMEDGKQRVGTIAEVKDMKGDWHEDPRYKGSLYFVCEQTAKGNDEGGEKKDDAGKKEKKKGGGKKGGKEEGG